MSNPSHHVVWGDRVDLKGSWGEAIRRISRSTGTDDFENAVWGLKIIIININNTDGPQLRTIIDDYIEQLRKEKYEELEPLFNTPAYENEDIILEKEMLPRIATFMIQLLENNGFIFYKSTYEEEGKMD